MLKPLYERALLLMTRLKSLSGVVTVELKHVYREYNTDADGVCNQVLNLTEERARNVQVNWNDFCDVDIEGDTLMRQ
jgi:hypothetical protein